MYCALKCLMFVFCLKGLQKFLFPVKKNINGAFNLLSYLQDMD